MQSGTRARGRSTECLEKNGVACRPDVIAWEVTTNYLSFQSRAGNALRRRDLVRGSSPVLSGRIPSWFICRNYANELSERTTAIITSFSPPFGKFSRTRDRAERTGADYPLKNCSPSPPSPLTRTRGRSRVGRRARATRNGNDSMNSANTALSRPTGGGSRVLERDKLTLLAAPPPWRINNNARRNIIMKDRWETGSPRTRGYDDSKFFLLSRFLLRDRFLVARRRAACPRFFLPKPRYNIKKRRDAYRPCVPSPLYGATREKEKDRERSLSIRKTNGGRSRREIERIRSPSGKLIVSLLTNRRGRVRVVTDVARAKWPSSSFAAQHGGAVRCGSMRLSVIMAGSLGI